MTALLLFLVTFIIYSISNFGRDTYYNYFVFLANAFLHGRLFVTENFSWLNELVEWQGHLYVAFPPMPAILLMPLVAFFGTAFHQPALSVFLASANVSLCYLVILKLFNKKRFAVWIGILYAFGTIQWYHAEVGSAWYIAHIISMFFIWLAILETATRRRVFLIGLLTGGAYLSRLPSVFAIFFPLIFIWEKFIFIENKKFKGVNFRNLILFGLGLLPAIILNALYNFIRFGTLNDIAYQLLPIFNEPWYKYGLISMKYIPIHIKEIFTSLPVFVNKPPYIIPSMFAMAIWFTTPAFILTLFARFKNRISIASLVALMAIAIPSLMHGSNGFTQFGYRHTLDYMPFILLLTACGMREKKFNWWIKVLIILSIVVNLWGVVMISFLNIWKI